MATSPSNPILIHKDLSGPGGFILSVKVYISPADVPRFFTLFKPVYDAVLAEPECRFFIVAQSSPSPQEEDHNVTCLSWIEGWSKPPPWFMAIQMKKAYYEPYMSETTAMFVRPRWHEILVPEEGLCHFKLPESATTS
jgi:hypothetical protein